MTQKINPNLFRLKNYSLSENKEIVSLFSFNQYYFFNRNIYFFIKKYTKFKIFFYNYTVQKCYLNKFKIFFFGYFQRKWNFKKKVKKK